MTPFTVLTGVAAPLLRPNIDTDAIIPSREMKGVGRTGLADGLFAGWRYTEVGGRTPDPAFVLNDPAYAGAQILLAGENFGCGSSREHAVWALAEFGVRAVVAESFAPIFQNNAVRNGLLPAPAAPSFIAHLAACVAEAPQTRRVTLDLVRRQVVAPDGAETPFEIGDEAREMLLGGLDVIALTLTRAPEIAAFRAGDRLSRPWAYLSDTRRETPA